MANAADNYKKWRTATGPQQMPATSFGDGLSSNAINAIAIIRQPPGMYHSQAEAVTVATPLGICESEDHGEKWTFARGADWQANVNGLYEKPDAAANAEDQAEPLFGEDWVTCLLEEPDAKRLWFGYRQKGVEARRANDGKVLLRADLEGSDALLVRSIWVRPKAPPLFAVYDDAKGGLKTFDTVTETLAPGAEAPKTAPALPAPAKAPDTVSVAALAKQLGVFKNNLVTGDGVFLGDDWRTGATGSAVMATRMPCFADSKIRGAFSQANPGTR